MNWLCHQLHITGERRIGGERLLSLRSRRCNACSFMLYRDVGMSCIFRSSIIPRLKLKKILDFHSVSWFGCLFERWHSTENMDMKMTQFAFDANASNTNWHNMTQTHCTELWAADSSAACYSKDGQSTRNVCFPVHDSPGLKLTGSRICPASRQMKRSQSLGSRSPIFAHVAASGFHKTTLAKPSSLRTRKSPNPTSVVGGSV